MVPFSMLPEIVTVTGADAALSADTGRARRFRLADLHQGIPVRREQQIDLGFTLTWQEQLPGSKTSTPRPRFRG